mmetsp:Transcript_24598/g.30686  ORF Transcript_24598/g.30686 Transcript_24598/m.30686 type:complete len:373 (+) Transcript_24598:45-1163(+)
MRMQSICSLNGNQPTKNATGRKMDTQQMDIDHAGTQMKSRSQPWVEKYRPKSVDDIAHQEEVVRTLKNAIDTGVMPHLLFYGPPGTGKTSTILAVAKTLFGPSMYRSRVLELNASDERGIKVIREKVKGFAQHSVGASRGESGYPCPPFKIIILDEADTMTPDAQAALRRTMEVYSKVTRFCLVCNYVSRIIEPLASRCAKFRFQSLSNHAMSSRLAEIATQEQVAFSEDTLQGIVEVAGGDMRKAVTTLQTAHQLFGAESSISKDEVLEISGNIPSTATEALWEAIGSNQFNRLQDEVTNLNCEGFPIAALLHRLQEEVIFKETLQDYQKAIICERLAEADMMLNDGASEALQLLDVAAVIMREVSAAGAG